MRIQKGFKTNPVFLKKLDLQVQVCLICPDVWKAALKKGLNISRICERALIFAVQNKEGGGTVGSGLAGSPGFEPGSREPKSPKNKR